MTPAQLVTLRTAIQADATLAPMASSGQVGAVADFANQVATPTRMIWRPSISVDELKGAIDWAAYGGLVVAAKRDVYRDMTAGASIDATKANVRAGFEYVFGAGSQTLAALVAISQRPATRFEALYAVDGVSSVFGQRLTAADVIEAMK